jgi:hypothetical protein
MGDRGKFWSTSGNYEARTAVHDISEKTALELALRALSQQPNSLDASPVFLARFNAIQTKSVDV